SSVSRSIISIIVVIAGTAMLFAPSFGMTIDASALVTTLRSPMFLAVLVGSVILVRLVCVQYWIWTKERDARIKAEETITQLEQRRAILDAGKPYPQPARARRPHFFSREVRRHESRRARRPWQSVLTRTLIRRGGLSGPWIHVTTGLPGRKRRIEL